MSCVRPSKADLLGLTIQIPPRILVEPVEALVAPVPPNPVKLWIDKVSNHLLSWNYIYTGYEINSGYEKRKGLWDYEEVRIDSSSRMGNLQFPSIQTEKEKVLKELWRLEPIFEILEADLEKAMDNLAKFRDEIAEMNGSDNPDHSAQLARIAIVHADVINDQFSTLYKSLLDQWQILHNCNIRLTHFWPLPFPSRTSAQTENFFGGDPFNLILHRNEVDALYSTYKTVLHIHNIYLARFISIVVNSRDLVRMSIPHLRKQLN